MNQFGHEGPTPRAVAAVSGPNAGVGRRPLPAWDNRTGLLAIPLALIVIYAFTPCLANGFVLWDDDRNFLDNPHVRGLGAAQVKWAWTTFWVNAYQPLAWLLYQTQYVFCQLDPRGYHLTSLLLHVANALVLYFLTVALLVRCRPDDYLRSPWATCLSAGLATALFAVHPLRVEPVAWASSQMYLPCILFSMLSVLAYLRAFPRASSPRPGWLVGSFAFFLIALLFHALPLGLPAALLILDIYPLRRLPDKSGRWLGGAAWRVLLEKVPFFVTSLVLGGLAIAARPEVEFPVERHGASEGIAQACYAIWFYLYKTVLPLNLITTYPYPKNLNWLAFPYGLSILATLALSGALFLMRRRWPGLLAAWLSYITILAPNSGFIRINDQIAADRYSYMAMLSLVMLAAAAFRWLWQTASRWHPAAAVATIAIVLGTLLGLTAMTRNQCRTWLNSDALWTHALTHGGKSSFVAQNNMGETLRVRGEDDAAMAHYIEALRLNPAYVPAINNLGVILQTKGNYQAAAARYTEALRLNPNFFHAHSNLGHILLSQGNHQAAEAHFNEALRVNPAAAQVHNDLGVALYKRGRFNMASAHFTEALRLKADDANAHCNIGSVFAVQERYAEAAAHFAEAIRLQPNYLGALYNLANAHSRMRNYEEAKADYAKIISLDPGFADAFNASALIMATCPDAKSRDGERAVKLAIRACELTEWNNPQLLSTLAAAHAEAGDFDAAVLMQKKGLELAKGEHEQDDYRTRLELYRAKRPYRQR